MSAFAIVFGRLELALDRDDAIVSAHLRKQSEAGSNTDTTADSRREPLEIMAFSATTPPVSNAPPLQISSASLRARARDAGALMSSSLNC